MKSKRVWIISSLTSRLRVGAICCDSTSRTWTETAFINQLELKLRIQTLDSSTCRTKSDIINHWESTTRDVTLATNTSSVGYERHSGKCVIGNTISTFTDLSLVQCTANCTGKFECLAVSFLASAQDAETLLAIEEIISNNPFGVAFDSEDVTRFGTCELKSASDYADCDDD